MPRWLPATGVVLLAGLAAAVCGGDDSGAPAANARFPVIATIAPVGALVRAVGGDMVDLHVLAGPGVDPHDYELRVDDRKAIDSAKLIVRNGAGIDSFLDGVVDAADPRVVTVTDGLKLRNGLEDGRDDPSSKDPHAWQDPTLAKAMALAVAAALEKADPAHAAAYRANAAAYATKLDEVDAEIRALVESLPPANRKIVTDHDAFGYFIDRYGLTFVGAVIPGTSTQAEPSAKQIAQLEDLIRAEGVRAIFAESSLDPKVAEQVAHDTGVKIVDDLYGDSLGLPGSGADTIEGMLLWNARKIVEALK
jgi:ABC-type Zn uptake system ZnuABC Zn-binding protein ZnuA